MAAAGGRGGDPATGTYMLLMEYLLDNSGSGVLSGDLAARQHPLHPKLFRRYL